MILRVFAPLSYTPRLEDPKIRIPQNLPLGLHGTLLPLIAIPLGMTGAVTLQFLSFGSRGILWFNVITIPYTLFAPWIAVVMIGYYLVWKYLVGFCNKALEIF